MSDGDLKAHVLRVLRDEVAPALQMDADGVDVLDVSGGVVRLRLGNMCAGCPSGIMVVVMELEQELRRRIPEVEYLEVAP
jgi:Fe-S cluster biogenesis protein NfuA